MDKTLVRNFFIFTTLTILCFGGLGFVLAKNNQQIDESRTWVNHTNNTLLAAEALPALVEGMMNAQRGFIITGKSAFMDNFFSRKRLLGERIDELARLTHDNPAQIARLEEIRKYYSQLSAKLEERARIFSPAQKPDLTKGLAEIDELRQNIFRLHNDLIAAEYELLSTRIESVEAQKDRYFATLIVGGVLCVTLMLLLNGFLLHAQSRRNKAEKFLHESEIRFSLAADGANDGIFDWDIDSGKVFYSKAFFSMLGYDKPAHTGHVDEFRAVILPEDREKAESYLQQYLRGEISEYSNTFRARHATGRTIWINSRARALYNKEGRPYRMVGAHTDITYMKEQQERLEQAKATAEKANLAKTDFLAHMSHEIRTPLTAISGIAEILERQKDKLNERQRHLVNTLISSTSTLKDLINDILDFSKIESGELTIESKEFDPMEIFEQVISIAAMQASEKGLAFTLDYEDLKGLRLKGDPLRIRQIFINLIGNAVKFTESGGRVDVVAYRITPDDGGEQIKVDVKDTGIGIEPDKLDMVFERFKQGDSSVSRKYGGTGLGLPISRNLARLMGGDIEVRSEPGKGSVFSLTLPLVLAFAGDIDAPSVSQMSRRKTAERLKALAGDKGRILMVEDYEGNIVVISYFLEDMGLAYDVARSGKQALEMWEANHYDLILMDIQMPEMDGFSATREIRRQEAEHNLKHTPIIGRTAHALVGDRDKCIEAGMDAYISKPIVEADLRARILTWLAASKKAA